MPLIPVQDILLSRLGLGINFIQWIPLRSYNDTQFVAVALFVVTPGQMLPLGNELQGDVVRRSLNLAVQGQLSVVKYEVLVYLSI